MPKYIVNIREVHIQMVEVEANDEPEAKLKVSRGEGNYLDDTLEYSHCLDSEYWTVDEI